MKIFLLFLAVTISLSTFAKTDTTKYWSSVERIFHGTTNQVKGITTDDNGNAYYSGYGYEINPGNIHALIVGKLDLGLNYTWKKHFYGFPTNQGLHSVVVDDNNLYIVGDFMRILEFPNDTLETPNPNGTGTFFVCLDASNGNVKYAKNLGYLDKPKLHFDGNKDLVLAYGALNGIQKYDGQNLDTLVNKNNLVRGYAYLTLNKSDGSVKNHCFGENDILGAIALNQLHGRKVHSLYVHQIAAFATTSFIEYRILDLDTKTVEYNKAKVDLSNSSIVSSSFIPNEKSWILLVQHANKDIIFNVDTIKNPIVTNVYKFTTALKVDSTLSIKKQLTFNSVLGYEHTVVNDTTLAFSFGADGDGYLFKNNTIDTVRFKGGVSTYQKGYFIAKCNLNFDNLTYSRFSVRDDNAGWQTGMQLQAIDLDKDGTVYGAVFHENDIIALPELVAAYNKSWKHISVIAKGQQVGVSSVLLEELSVNHSILIYPNPVSDVLYIQSESAIKKVLIFDATGKLVSTGIASQINVSNLKSGVYYLTVETDNGAVNRKFVR